MEENHIENLKKICRLCGKLDLNNLKSFNIHHNKNDFKKIVRDEDSDNAIFPPKRFCYACRMDLLSPLSNARVRGGDRSQIDAILKKFKVFEFSEHTENCQICQQFSNPTEVDSQSSTAAANADDVPQPDEAGTQESDLDDNGANGEPSFAFHVQCLKEVCSLCGVRVKQRTNLRPYKFERKENEVVFLDILKQNRNALNPHPKKEKFCRQCINGVLLKFDNARKGRKDFEDAQESLLEKLYIFKQHKEHDCDICCQYSQEEIKSFNQSQVENITPNNDQSSQHSGDDSDSFLDCEEPELVNVGTGDSGDNMDYSMLGFSTPNKRNRSQISDSYSSTDECLETTPRPRRPYTPKKMNIGDHFHSSPTVYDKVSFKFFFINDISTHIVCFA